LGALNGKKNTRTKKKNRKEELIEEQNELLRKLVSSLEDIEHGRYKPFKLK
jgi:hypothetical protein